MHRTVTAGSMTLLTTIAALCIIAQPPLTAQDSAWGIVTQIYGANHDAKVADLGVGSVRIDFNWHEMETAQDVYSWAHTDQMVADATARGLEILATLAYPPSWAGPCQHCAPYSYLDWQDFVYDVIYRYQAYSNLTFGVWNEPDLQFLDDDGVASKWTLLFYYASSARNLANPDARLAGPETSWQAVPSTYFYHAVNGAAPYVAPQDVVTVHWYSDALPLNPINSYMNYVVATTNRETWLSEVGLATCNDTTQDNFVDDLSYAFANRTSMTWSKMFLYVLQNGNNCSEAIVRSNWTNRPAFVTYQAWVP